MNMLAAILVTMVSCLAFSSESLGAGSRLYVASGKVLVTQGDNPARRAKNGEAIISGMLINTADNSAALLRFEDGQVVAMQANSAFYVGEYHYDARHIENSRIAFSLLRGGIRAVSGKIGRQGRQAFRLLTPNATIGSRGSDFMLAMVGESMYGHVLAGKTGVTDAAGTTVLEAGQSAVVASRGASASVISPSAIPSGTFSKLLSIPIEPSANAAQPRGPVAASGAAVSGAAVSPGAVREGIAGGSSGSVEAPKESPPGARPEQSAKPRSITDQEETGTGIGIAGKIGTLGYGAELDFGISDRFSCRIGVNAYSKRHNAHSSLLKYDFDLQFQTAMAVVDWYPFADGFRASAGVAYDDNRISFDANDTGGNYIVNGRSYSTTQVGAPTGVASCSKAAPYLGVGWRNRAATIKGWSVATDIGVLFQGDPRIELAATCIDPLICSELQADLEAERARMRNDLDFLKRWPVASIGISYHW